MNRRIALFKEPQKKYNLQFDVASDFILSPYPDPELAGKYIKSIPINHLNFKYLYIPPTVYRGLYLRKDSYLIPAVQNIFIPLNRVTKLILVRPDGLVSGNIYFQYWVTNVESVKIYDSYYKHSSISAGSFISIDIPFPTYNMKVLILLSNNPTDIDYTASIEPFNTHREFTLDYQANITETEINNFYKFAELGGSGAITSPHYTFPSFQTRFQIENDDAGVAISDCWFELISWLGEL